MPCWSAFKFAWTEDRDWTSSTRLWLYVGFEIFVCNHICIFVFVGFEIFVCNRQSVILSLARCLVIQVLNLCYYHQFYWISNFVLPSQDDLTPLHREEGRQIRVWEPERLYPGLQETKHVEFVTESEQYICPCRGAVMCSQGKPETKIITHVIPFGWVLLIWGYRFSAGDT